MILDNFEISRLILFGGLFFGLFVIVAIISLFRNYVTYSSNDFFVMKVTGILCGIGIVFVLICTAISTSGFKYMYKCSTCNTHVNHLYSVEMLDSHEGICNGCLHKYQDDGKVFSVRCDSCNKYKNRFTITGEQVICDDCKEKVKS